MKRWEREVGWCSRGGGGTHIQEARAEAIKPCSWELHEGIVSKRVECRTCLVEGEVTGTRGNRDLASKMRRHRQERVEVWDAVASPERLGVVVEKGLHLSSWDRKGGREARGKAELTRDSHRRWVEVGWEGLT